MVLGAILGAKTVPKWVQKSIEILMDFWNVPGKAFRVQEPFVFKGLASGDWVTHALGGHSLES